MVRAFVLALLLLASTNGSNHKIKNNFGESSYFRALVQKINSYPNLMWRAAYGSLRSLDIDEVSQTIQLNSTPTANHPSLNKRQMYSPSTIDWRTTGLLAQPEHQGACGSCWAFASVHVLMDNTRIQSANSQVYMSTQHVLECCVSRACGGCSGASDNAAGLDFLSRKFTVDGVCKQYAYYGDARVNPAYSQPGQQCSESCHYPNINIPVSSIRKYNITGFVRLNSSKSTIKAALASGPLLAAIQLYGDLYLYRSGIYRHIDGPPLGYHSVELVGYGTEAGQDYWILKNSWGVTWGEQGYFRIKAGNNEAHIEDHVIKPLFLGQQKQNRGYDEAFQTPVGGISKANTNAFDIQDVANFIAHEIKPICSDGKLDDYYSETIENGETYSVLKVLQASTQIAGGIVYNIKTVLSLPRCSEHMYVQAKVYLPPANREYILLKYTYTTPQVSNKDETLRGDNFLFLFIILTQFLFFH